MSRMIRLAHLAAAPSLSPAEIKARLAEAADTLRAMPSDGCWPGQSRAIWPAVLQSLRDWMPTPGDPEFEREMRRVQKDLEDERHRFRAKATADQIARMDEALPWLHRIADIDTRRVVFARAMGISLRRLGREMGRSKSWIEREEREGLEIIARALRQTQASGLSLIAVGG